jgi:Putative transposase of IS4/5 family (DUF4096)
MEKRERSGYPSDVTDEEWVLVAPYLALCKEEAQQRDYPLRAVFNSLRYLVRTGCQWCYMPNDLPPWNVVYQQAQRWIRARCHFQPSPLTRCGLCMSAVPRSGGGTAPSALEFRRLHTVATVSQRFAGRDRKDT